LNWLIKGRQKLFKDKLQLTQTPEQKTLSATLLLSSDSPAAFVGSCSQREKGTVICLTDLYEAYQN